MNFHAVVLMDALMPLSTSGKDLCQCGLTFTRLLSNKRCSNELDKA